MLAVIASVGRYKKGEPIYREGDRAESVFNIITGVVKAYTPQGGRKQTVIGFMFPRDLIGLADGGRYVNSATAVTAVTLYKMPAVALEARLRRNPGLDFQVICKLCRELRSAQQHALLLSKHRATARLGLFLQMLEVQEAAAGGTYVDILLPMSRRDIGAYVNISPEAVSRAMQELVRRGVISLRNRRRVRIIDRARLEGIISESAACAGAR